MEVRQALDLFRDSNLVAEPPSLEGLVRYYESRAPAEFPVRPPVQDAGPLPIRLERQDYHYPPGRLTPGVANVSIVRLGKDRPPEVLVCDMRYDRVLALDPRGRELAWRVLAELPAPAHAEVVDLDGDGILDLLVACMGTFYPSDAHLGKVVWLRGRKDGTYTPLTLLEGVGRVADVQAANFNGDGKLDLVVAVFGWRTTGEILCLENRTTDWAHPAFERRQVDDRHGTIHVPVCDLNGDGRPDFVALISQEYETVVAFLNDGGGRFRKSVIYAAPHSAFGSSGIQLVDLDGDGDLDVLYTNGDVLDRALLKPYHAIRWLENPGRGRFPFVHHHVADMYGVSRAIAVDLTGDGKLDIAAVSHLFAESFPRREELKLDAVVLFEQTTPGTFVRHTLEAGTCDHFTCAAGDLYGDGRTCLVVGSHFFKQEPAQPEALTVWRPADAADAKRSGKEKR
jgi:hypothetical protein